MKRIGIIGTESSHAMAFAAMLNVPDPKIGHCMYEDARVVGVYGPDEQSAKEIMDRAHVDFIAQTPEDFFGKVDAMMVTSRRGSVHYGYAMPFIRKGIPVFIDKPFTMDYAEALELVGEAKRSHVPLCGGSGCKYADDVLMLRNIVKDLTEEEKLVTGTMNFAVDMDSAYDGFFFYASHLTEMTLAVFGQDIKSVRAFEKNRSLTVIASYEHYDVTLSYTKDTQAASCLLITPDKNIYREIDIGMIYRYELEKFITMIQTGKMPADYESLVKPVAVMNAIKESYSAKREIEIL